MAIFPARKRILDRRARQQAETEEAAPEAERLAKVAERSSPPAPAPSQRQAVTRQNDEDGQDEEDDQDDQDDRASSQTPSAPPEDNWSDPDTASIASRNSEDLYARRPNRWRGDPRTWWRITEHDRAVAAALWRTRDRDLSAHLYNAFFIKKHAGQGWTPGNYWTAWPLRPTDNLDVFDSASHAEGACMDAGSVDGGDNESAWTFRSRHPPVGTRPSGPLEEMLTATIQRVARELFQNSEQHGRTAVVLADDELAEELLHPSVRHMLSQMDKMLSILHMLRVALAGDTAAPVTAQTQQQPRLHRWQREMTVESAAGTRQYSRPLLPQKPSRKRTCVRPDHWTPGPRLMTATARTPEQVAASIHKFYGPAEDEQAQPVGKSRKRVKEEVPKRTPLGRPRKQKERLPGETEKQFLIRIARQSHRRIPDFSDDESKPSKEDDGAPAVVTYVPPPFVLKTVERRVSFSDQVQRIPNWIKNVAAYDDGDDGDDDDDEEEESEAERRSHKKKKAAASSATTDKDGPGDSNIADWPLRNWKDVLGAAALSGGFSPEVLARAAQRCADLFGESMALSTLHGVPGATGKDQTLQEQQQKKTQPLSVDRVVFRPTHAGAPAVKPEPEPDTLSPLQTLKIEVHRAQAQGRAGLARRRAVMEEALGGALPTVAVNGEVDRDKGGDDNESDEPEDGDSDSNSESDSESESESEEEEEEEEKNESEEEEEEVVDDDTRPQQKTPSRSKSRSMSIMPPPHAPVSTGTASPAPRGATPKRRAKPGPPPKSTPTLWYCPRPNCPRALDGFPRRPNMIRHMKMVHALVLESHRPGAPSQK